MLAWSDPMYSIQSEGSHVLGSDGFREDAQKKVQAGSEVPRMQKYIARRSLDSLASEAVERGEWMEVAYKEHGYTMREIADFAQVHYSLVSKIIKAWEGK